MHGCVPNQSYRVESVLVVDTFLNVFFSSFIQREAFVVLTLIKRLRRKVYCNNKK